MGDLNIETIIDIAKNAGKAILEVYNSKDFGTEIKDDLEIITTIDNPEKIETIWDG